MDNAEILKELIDEEAIAYVKEHEKEYDKLFDSYITMQRQTINIGGKEFVFGVDLSNSKDMNTYSPPITKIGNHAGIPAVNLYVTHRTFSYNPHP